MSEVYPVLPPEYSNTIYIFITFLLMLWFFKAIYRFYYALNVRNAILTDRLVVINGLGSYLSYFSGATSAHLHAIVHTRQTMPPVKMKSIYNSFMFFRSQLFIKNIENTKSIQWKIQIGSTSKNAILVILSKFKLDKWKKMLLAWKEIIEIEQNGRSRYFTKSSGSSMELPPDSHSFSDTSKLFREEIMNIDNRVLSLLTNHSLYSNKSNKYDLNDNETCLSSLIGHQVNYLHENQCCGKDARIMLLSEGVQNIVFPYTIVSPSQLATGGNASGSTVFSQIVRTSNTDRDTVNERGSLLAALASETQDSRAWNTIGSSGNTVSSEESYIRWLKDQETALILLPLPDNIQGHNNINNSGNQSTHRLFPFQSLLQSDNKQKVINFEEKNQNHTTSSSSKQQYVTKDQFELSTASLFRFKLSDETCDQLLTVSSISSHSTSSNNNNISRPITPSSVNLGISTTARSSEAERINSILLSGSQQRPTLQHETKMVDFSPESSYLVDARGRFFESMEVFGLDGDSHTSSADAPTPALTTNEPKKNDNANGVEEANKESSDASSSTSVNPITSVFAHTKGGKFTKEDCVICLTEPKQIVLLPCRHLCVCASCLIYVDKCPVCRAFFEQYICISYDKEDNSQDILPQNGNQSRGSQVLSVSSADELV